MDDHAGPAAGPSSGSAPLSVVASKEERSRLYLVRHGETDWNAEDRVNSRTDRPLTATGERQARDLGRRIAHLPFDRVIVSPLSRAGRTAELILEARETLPPLEVDPALTEVDCGPYEGWTEAELAVDPGALAWRAGLPVDGAESDEAAAVRADAVFARLAELPGLTLVVSHGHFLKTLVAHSVLQMPIGEVRRIRMANCAPAIIETRPRIRLVALNVE